MSVQSTISPESTLEMGARWNPFSFLGRARRPEFWIYQAVFVWIGIALLFAMMMAGALFGFSTGELTLLAWCASLPLHFSNLAVIARRGRDAGLSPWICLVVIPIQTLPSIASPLWILSVLLGLVLVTVLGCLPSHEMPSQFAGNGTSRTLKDNTAQVNPSVVSPLPPPELASVSRQPLQDDASSLATRPTPPPIPGEASAVSDEPQAAPAPSDDAISDLVRLAELFERGFITEEEFRQQKRLLLGEPEGERPQS